MQDQFTSSNENPQLYLSLDKLMTEEGKHYKNWLENSPQLRTTVSTSAITDPSLKHGIIFNAIPAVSPSSYQFLSLPHMKTKY